MTGPALADNAHSYVFQTLADLGLVGLALSLARRDRLGLRGGARDRPVPRPRARAATLGRADRPLTMIAVVIVFAVHSAIDWTWFVPGDAVIALLCAGWVAGRGPATERVAPATTVAARASRARRSRRPPPPPRSRSRWSSPGRNGSRCAPSRRRTPASPRSPTAGSTPPGPTSWRRSRATRSTSPRWSTSGDSYARAGKLRLAQATFEREVALQPSNAASWKALRQFDSSWALRPRRAGEHALYAALYLEPLGSRAAEAAGRGWRPIRLTRPARAADLLARAAVPTRAPSSRRRRGRSRACRSARPPRSTPSSRKPSRSGIARLRRLATPARISTRASSQRLEGVVEHRRRRRSSSCPRPGGRRRASSRCSSSAASSRCRGSRRRR